MGPNIYGFYYTHANLCATFCTACDVKGHAALLSQSGGIGTAIIGFSRSAKMGVSAIVGAGNCLSRRRCRSRGGRRISLPARHSGLRLLDRTAGLGAGRQVQMGARRGAALSQLFFCILLRRTCIYFDAKCSNIDAASERPQCVELVKLVMNNR